MARDRMRAAVRKAARSEAETIADGVRQTATALQGVVVPGSLYWQGPLQYVVEQMAPRVCANYELEPERADDVAAYLMAGLNEYVVALISGFDHEHFEAWIAAETRMAGRMPTDSAG